MSELGDLLRQARESKAVSLEQAEAATRIRHKYLAALEEGDMAALPGDVYVKGFLRNYATYLGLDPQRVLNLCPGVPQAAPAVARTESSVLVSIERPRSWRWVGWALLVLAIAALGVLAWQVQPWKGMSSLFQAEPSATATLLPDPTRTIVPTSAPTASSAEAPTTAPAGAVSPDATGAPTQTGGVSVRVQVTGRSWMQVTVDDKVVYAGVLSDTTQDWTGARQIAVQIGDASRVDVTVNGIHLGILGRAEEVIKRSWGPDFTGEPTPTPSPTATAG